MVWARARPAIRVAPPCSSQESGSGPEQGHRQLVDLVEEVFEAFVFGEPRADLGKEFLGDVDRARLARFLEGEVLAGVQGPAVVAAAGRSAAAVGVGAEGGGKDGGSRWELLESVLEHTQDEGRVIGNVHGASGKRTGDVRA